jgi:capsular exopolysaccharide synthesis family protein
MSKFFKQTQRANEDHSQGISRSLDAAPRSIENLLESINETVDEQASGLRTSPSDSKVEPVLDAAQNGQSVACEVVEFPTEPYGQMHISRSGERILFPELATNSAPEMEAYRKLRTRVLRLQASRGFRTVVISSAAKGEGKTLTSTNLGLFCAQLPEYRVLLVDGDLRTRGLSRLLGGPDTPGLAEVLAGDVRPEAAVLATDVPNLYVMGPGRPSISPSELLTGTSWKDFIAWAGEQFKLVLVDAPPVFATADFELISAGCDGILLVVRARVTTRVMLQTLMRQIDSSKLLGVTLNSVNGFDHTQSYYYYETKEN